MKKLIDNYKIGRACNPKNIEEIRENILDLTSKKNKEIEINLKIAKKELCWENEEKRLLFLYKSLKK